ncbi:hypothetical protein [Aminobacter phage Erebus]|nr:hypothetical protein [Aminobacter phage Erebus]
MAKKHHLTPAQIRELRRVAQNHGKMILPRSEATLFALERRGLIKTRFTGSRYYFVHLTQEGEKHLPEGWQKPVIEVR